MFFSGEYSSLTFTSLAITFCLFYFLGNLLRLNKTSKQNFLVMSWPHRQQILDTLTEIYYRLAKFQDAQKANNIARKFAQDENVRKSIAERAQKIAAKLKEQKER